MEWLVQGWFYFLKDVLREVDLAVGDGAGVYSIQRPPERM